MDTGASRQDERVMRPGPARRPCLFVVGTGRSGTSAIALIMQRLGYVVPPPEVQANETNPRGFAESQWTVDFHERLMDEATVFLPDTRPDAAHVAMRAVTARDVEVAAAWLRSNDSGRGLLIKDPRTALFLPLWHEAAARCGMTPVNLTMLRLPTEVAMSHSVYYAGGEAGAQFLAGWTSTMLQVERCTRGLERAFVRYDDLLSDPVETIAQLLAALPTLSEDGIGMDDIRAAAEIIEPGLRRMRPQWDDIPAPSEVLAFSRDAWSALAALRAGVDSTTELDELAEGWSTYYSLAQAVVGSATAARVVRERRKVASLRATARRLPGQVWRRLREPSMHARSAE